MRPVQDPVLCIIIHLLDLLINVACHQKSQLDFQSVYVIKHGICGFDEDGSVMVT